MCICRETLELTQDTFLLAAGQKSLSQEAMLARESVICIDAFSHPQASPVWANAQCCQSDLSSPHSPWDGLPVMGKHAKLLVLGLLPENRATAFCIDGLHWQDSMGKMQTRSQLLWAGVRFWRNDHDPMSVLSPSPTHLQL